MWPRRIQPIRSQYTWENSPGVTGLEREHYRGKTLPRLRPSWGLDPPEGQTWISTFQSRCLTPNLRFQTYSILIFETWTFNFKIWAKQYPRITIMLLRNFYSSKKECQKHWITPIPTCHLWRIYKQNSLLKWDTELMYTLNTCVRACVLKASLSLSC